jgi:hypothetical protein
MSNLGSLTFDEVLKDYYDSNQYISNFFNYNSVITLIFLFVNKLATYAWNFGDIFLMVISRALYARYASLNNFLESLMVPDGSVCLIKKGKLQLLRCRDVSILNRLLQN